MLLCAVRHLKGSARSGRPREIDDADRALMASLAGQRPADLGYAAELWTNDLPWAHVRKTAEVAGHPRLATLSCGTVRNILANAQTESHKMAHYRERRNPNLKAKVHNVLSSRERPALHLDGDGDPVPWEVGQEGRASSHDEKSSTQDARKHRLRPATRGMQRG